MRRTRIKICCMQSEEEARLAIAAGADALGLVGTMPSGPGPIDDALIAAIAARVPPPVATLLLTSETGAEAIIAHASRCRTNTLQLVDRVEPADYPRLRRALPGIKLVQVVHVGGEAAVAEAIAAAAHADALLLDSGRPHEPIKVLGARAGPTTGRSAARSWIGPPARCSSPAACARTTSPWRSERCGPSGSMSAPACGGPTTLSIP